MATINRIENCTLRSIAAVQPRVYRKTNTRRVIRIMQNDPQAVIPDEADVADVAQYQIECTWDGRIYDPHPTYSHKTPITKCDITKIHTMVFLGLGEGTGRSNGSKILVTPGAKEAYAILAWSDLFGHSIKENQLGSKRKDGTWLVYAVKLDAAQLAELQEALYQAGVDY